MTNRIIGQVKRVNGPVIEVMGITDAETDPFFESMAMDLTVTQHDRESFDRYVFGSAEVVGIMCLRAFLNGSRRGGDPVVEPDASTVASAAKATP